MLRHRNVVPVCLALASALPACGNEPTSPPPVALSSTQGVVAAAAGTVASVKTVPDSILMIVDDRAGVIAQVRNPAGELLAKAVTWTVKNSALVTILGQTGSSFDFRAARKGTTSIKATVGGRSGLTKLVLRPKAGARVVLAPATASLAPLETVGFAVSGLSGTGETATVSATWTATGGTVSASGDYQAGSAPGTYQVIARAPFGAADTAVVTITASPISRLVVTPEAVTLAAGETTQFESWGINALGDSTDAPTTWSATGGSITGAGVYTAGDAAGTWQVTGTLTGTSITATASVTTQASGGGTGGGIPFGLFGMVGRRLVDPYTSSVQAAQPDTILADLAAARARGARLFVNFTGGSATNVTDADGHFDYGRWKTRLDRFLPIVDQLNDYVADGTLQVYLMIDEPFATGTWGGQTVPKTTLDSMAQYAKSLFPGLLTAVRAAPTELDDYPWQYLDVSWAQYTARKGPIAEYVPAQVASAQAAGLGLVVGLNISKGGDGSSGAGSTNQWVMSGAEILQYGHALLDASYACAFQSWDNRASVIDRPDVAAALQDLATAARSHPATSCRQ